MKKFITKTLLFTSPFMIVYVILIGLPMPEGSLHRVGHFIDYTPNYRINLPENLSTRKSNFKYLNEIKSTKIDSFSVLTIGDSFSKQAEYGYQNYLSNDTLSVIHFNKNTNSIQTLTSLINGDFFEKIKVKYVILETVERQAGKRASRINDSKILNFDEIIKLEDTLTDLTLRKNRDIKARKTFFRRQVIYFPIVNIFRELDDNSLISKTYKVETNNYNFSVDNKDLLFYGQSLDNQKFSSDTLLIENLNNQLNTLNTELEKMGIKLIVLIVPTKYDIYYDDISNKEKYPKPYFFEKFKKYVKQYKYIETRDILKNEIQKNKDLYYYDDDHWTPYGAKVISEELRKMIN